MLKKILIVDDSLFIREILSDLLAKNYEIIEADSADTAIESFSKEKPDLILLDILMPGGDKEGIRALREIIKRDAKAKVVMITAVGQELVIKECKNIGALDYIIKPFDENEVCEIVSNHLS